jgi:hypothetical protein
MASALGNKYSSSFIQMSHRREISKNGFLNFSTRFKSSLKGHRKKSRKRRKSMVTTVTVTATATAIRLREELQSM